MFFQELKDFKKWFLLSRSFQSRKLDDKHLENPKTKEKVASPHKIKKQNLGVQSTECISTKAS